MIDGDTVDVAVSDGSPGFRVRLIGIDAPESGACEAAAATWTLAGLVQDHTVVLTAGGDGEDTDTFGRFLRYVDVDGVDAGLRLVENGVAVARYDSRDGYGAHTREATYVAADNATPDYTCPPPTTQPPPPPPPAAASASAPAASAPASASAPAASAPGCSSSVRL